MLLGFQCQNDDVVPDIVTMAKPMGNGMPLAAVATTRAVAGALKPSGQNTLIRLEGIPFVQRLALQSWM
jgi:ethanolamine-phosphate phospho-lyase